MYGCMADSILFYTISTIIPMRALRLGLFEDMSEAHIINPILRIFPIAISQK